jgi:hypothetical protein
MNRLQQAMLVNAKIDHLYATEEDLTEIMQFNVIYEALLEIDELINAAESEQLDEEVVYELTPAGEDFLNGVVNEYKYDYAPNPLEEVFGDPEPTEAFSGAIEEEEFNDFSPSVGTFEGTQTLNSLLNWQRTPVSEQWIDRDVVADPTINRPVINDIVDGHSFHYTPSRAPVSELVDLIGAYKNVMQRAPVAERVHVPFKGVQQTITHAFQPCGGDITEEVINGGYRIGG